MFIPSIEKFETKRDIDKESLAQFEQIFPRYSWVNQEFSVTYRNENCDISVTRVKSGNKYTLKFTYCKELADFHKKLKSCYKVALDEFDARVEQENKKKHIEGRLFFMKK